MAILLSYQIHHLEEEFEATKQEYEQKTTTPVRNILGTMIHIEMNYDTRNYDLLFNKYGIIIIEGVDGMTLERFKEPSRPENKIHWPPLLKGPVEND